MRLARGHLIGVGLALATAIGCSSGPAAPATPTMFDPNAPRVGQSTGPATIEYAGANYAPGFTIDGCGALLAGCAGRLRLTFRIRSTGTGDVLRTAGSLHGTNKVACLAATGPPFHLDANTTVLIDLVFDQVDRSCALPFEATDLGVNVEGSSGASGRQEFGIRYRFAP